ncbi:unnamed protein product, partial [Ectocarpus sp. 12 AP-2014]
SSLFLVLHALLTATFTMFTEEQSFALPSLNSAQCLCSYEDANEQPRLLVVNETGLLKLRAGLGPAGNRYGLGQLLVASLPEVAKVVACTVVRTRRGDGSGGEGGGGGRTPGMVCVAMLVPPLPACAAVAVGNHGGGGGGTKQGDAAGGPAVRAAAATAAGGGGLLNVYPLDGERGSEVDRALRREPQQLVLPYMPVG